MFLTQEGGILGPLNIFFGNVMNVIFQALAKIGIVNIGIAIILFTLVTRIILYPFTVAQQKQSRMMSYIQPEIKMIQDKYKGKTDQASMMAMNAETKAVYEKYGTSMTGSCVQLLIQMPIIFSLYRVIMKIPAYVQSIYIHYENILTSFGATTDNKILDVANKIIELVKDNKALTTLLTRTNGFVLKDNILSIKEGLQVGQVKNYIIDFMYNLNPAQMEEIAQQFPGATNSELYKNSIQFLEKSNYFLGMNLPTTPWDGFQSGKIIYLLIPIFAGLTQYLSSVLMQGKKRKDPLKEENDLDKSMKTMMFTMPLFSVFFCFTFASGIGIYWIATTVFMVIQQLILNYYMDKTPVEEMIKQNIQKANIKRQKKGLPPLDENATVKQYVKTEKKEEKEYTDRQNKIEAQVEKTKKAEKYYFENEDKDSMFSKVNMVKKYNEKNEK